MDQSQQAKPGGNGLGNALVDGPLRVVAALIVPVIGFFLLWRSFIFMRDADAPMAVIAVVALAVGIFGVWFLYWASNNLVERLPMRMRDALRPYVFVGPAMAVLGVYLVYPALDTFQAQRHESQLDQVCRL